MKKYEVISLFEASDSLFRARYDFGFGSILHVYCDCNSRSVWTNYSKGATSVPDWQLVHFIQLAISRWLSFMQSGRKTESQAEQLSLEFDVYGLH